MFVSSITSAETVVFVKMFQVWGQQNAHFPFNRHILKIESGLTVFLNF